MVSREGRDQKQAWAERLQESLRPRYDVFRYVSHYEELPAGRAEAMVCCARRAEAGICAGGVPCSLI